MGWNEPDKPKDPWGNKNQPPDLEELLTRLHNFLKKAFFGGSGKGSSPSNPSSPNNKAGGIIVAGLGIAAVILWFLAGIFIVDPAEQAAILYFGKYKETVGSGPHWIPRLIASKVVVNVDRVLDYSYSAQMLTTDENLVSVSVAVQYRIGDLQAYLFNVADPQESLQQATSSALRQVIGTTTLDKIITEGREVWGSSVQETLIQTLAIYKTGIMIVNVSPQPARAPDSVQDAFDDAIKAQEDEKRFKDQADAYVARVVPIAAGNAKRIQQESEAYARQVVLKAQGDVSGFLALLPEYKIQPAVTMKRLYLETMEKVLSNTSKVIMETKAGSMVYLPLEKLLESSKSVIPSFQSSELNKMSSNPESMQSRESATVRRTWENGGAYQ